MTQSLTRATEEAVTAPLPKVATVSPSDHREITQRIKGLEAALAATPEDEPELRALYQQRIEAQKARLALKRKAADIDARVRKVKLE